VKELDDEEASYATLGEPLYRVETGNYEYRLVPFFVLTIRNFIYF
jgi:hypothetical protein